jgi:uncharacterized protein (TIGR03435 family)
MRKFAGVLIAGVAAASMVAAEQAPSFDVASVKVNHSGGQTSRTGAALGTGRFDVTNATVYTLILNAYSLQDFQLAGGPSWIRDMRVDIAARTSATATREDISSMLQTLLSERFHLVTHRESREMPTYALVLARSDGRPASHLAESTTDCAAVTRSASLGPPRASASGQTLCGTTMTPGSLNAGSMSMPRLATSLAGIVGRMVKDETGLTGLYDLQLTFTPERGIGPPPAGAPVAPPPDPNAPSVFAALVEQLGLKLESKRAPVDMLVIDRVEVPSED